MILLQWILPLNLKCMFYNQLLCGHSSACFDIIYSYTQITNSFNSIFVISLKQFIKLTKSYIMACLSCRRAKKKCVACPLLNSCTRCSRLNKPCSLSSLACHTNSNTPTIDESKDKSQATTACHQRRTVCLAAFIETSSTSAPNSAPSLSAPLHHSTHLLNRWQPPSHFLHSPWKQFPTNYLKQWHIYASKKLRTIAGH